MYIPAYLFNCRYLGMVMVFKQRMFTVISIVLLVLPDVILALQIPAPATFRLTENGKPCLLASFNASVTVSYEKIDEQTNQTHAENVTFDVPPWSTVEGKCSKSVEEPAILSLTWNDSITLSLKFHGKSPSSSGRWHLQQIYLRYDLSDPKMFPDSVEPFAETYLVASNLSFLGARANRAYVCPRSETFKLREKNGDTVGYVTIEDVKFQPFGVTGVHFRKGNVCGESRRKKKKPATPKTSLGTTSSLVVASCLALIVLIVVIVYVISRSTAISGYTSM